MIVVVNIIMNSLFINWYGVVGAILASITSEAILLIILIVKARRNIEISFLFFGSIKYLVSSLFMLIVMRVVSYSLEAELVIKIVVEFCSGVACYYLCCFILRDRFVIIQTQRIIEMTKRVIMRKKIKE